MTNTLLTPTVITDEALMILHQKCNFLGNIYRGYDDRFARSGAKIGDTLTIRLPNEFTSTTGALLSTQDITESSTTLQLDTQRHVDFSFSSDDLTLTVDEFSDRYLKPAMSVLAAHIEDDVMDNVFPDVANAVDSNGSAMGVSDVLNAGVKLDSFLAPRDGMRKALLNPQATADLVSDTKALFNSSAELSEQYKEGQMGRAYGFDFYQNSIIPAFTSGTADSVTTYLVNDSNTLSGSSITVDTGSVTLVVGDVITIQGLNACHPETKSDLGFEKQFVITSAAAAAGTTSLAISPAIVPSGAKQNVVSATGFNNATIKSVGGSSTVLRPSVFFHRDAFCFGTADLVMPKGVDFSARRVMDGISMRVVRQYDINSDTFPCRIDVIYGSQTLRQQLAVRVFNN